MRQNFDYRLPAPISAGPLIFLYSLIVHVRLRNYQFALSTADGYIALYVNIGVYVLLLCAIEPYFFMYKQVKTVT